MKDGVKSPDEDFDLPRHTTSEQCVEDYYEEVGENGELQQHTIPQVSHQVEATPGYATKGGKDFSLQIHSQTAQVQTFFKDDGRKQTKVKAAKTAWIHNFISLNGAKFDFTGRDYLHPIYNSPNKRILLMTGRQVEKSTLLANNLTIMCVLIPYFRCLYVSPSHVQTRTFSNDKLKPNLERSPLIARYLQDNKVSTQVFEKGFTNGAFIFLRSAFFSADRARGISADLLCYDKDAYLLTREGWMKFKDIDFQTEIATRNPDTGNVEWHYPVNITRKKHTGKMVTFKHQGFHMRVTDNHDMLINWAVKPYQEDEWEKVRADKLHASNKMGFKMGNPVSWKKNHPDFKIFKRWSVEQRTSNGGKRTNNYSGLAIPYLKFAELVGWYLAEGFMSGTGSSRRPCLILNLKTDLKKVEACLKESNLTYSIGKGSSEETCVVTLNSSHLTRYFEDNRGAYNKYIPREFMEHPEALSKLLYGLYQGEACYHKGESWENGTLRTRSNKLAQDVQEAWLRINRPAVIHKRMMWNKHQDAHDYNEGELTPLYEICSYNRDYMIFWNTDKKKRISTEDVEDEEVYCVTVPNHQIIVKGNFESKPIVSGNCIDEIQDMIMGNIPVIAQCLSHSKHQYQVFAGTPKSYDNTIQNVWETTSQNEWMVKCGSCNKYNYLGIHNIGKFGPICKKCGSDLDVTKGQWMKAKQDCMWEGFRIPQLMVPWIAAKGSDPWKSLVHQMETYPESQFYNEVLGLSFDNAAKPITRADILQNCKEDQKFVSNPYKMNSATKTRMHKMTLFAGIDWGEGNDGTGTDVMGKLRTASYTVMTIGGFVGGGRFRVVYVKKYKGREVDPDFIIKDVINTCIALGVKSIGADWGHGWGVNNKLARSFGPQRFMQFMYVDNQKEVRKWDPIGYKFQLMRNHVMSEIFFAFKEGKFEFPPLEEWEVYAQDMLNISVEYIEYQRKLRYVHRPSDPDDWFHSLVYAKQAAEIYHGKR